MEQTGRKMRKSVEVITNGIWSPEFRMMVWLYNELADKETESIEALWIWDRVQEIVEDTSWH